MCDTLQSVCLQLLTATVQSSPGGKNQPDSAEKREEDTEVTQKIKVEKKNRTDLQLEVLGHNLLFSLFFSSFPTCLCAWPSSCPFLLPICFPAALCNSPGPGNLLESLCMAGAGGDEFDGAAHKTALLERETGMEKNQLQIFFEPQNPPSLPSHKCSHKWHLWLTESTCVLWLPPPHSPAGLGRWDEALPLSGWNIGW